MNFWENIRCATAITAQNAVRLLIATGIMYFFPGCQGLDIRFIHHKVRLLCESPRN